MAKPGSERLEASTYPWSFDMPPRFGDMDALRHLNNVALARFYEDGRIRFTDASGARAAIEAGHGLLVAEVAIQYLAEGRYPDTVSVSTGMLRLGRTSFTLAQALFQNRACIGACDTTLVYVHRREGGARPLPEGLRAALLAYALTPGSPAPAPPAPGAQTPAVQATPTPSSEPSREPPHA